MRNMEFKMERQGLLTVGQEVDVTESVLPTSYYYTIQPMIAMSKNYPGYERLQSRKGIVKDIKETDRGYYTVVGFMFGNGMSILYSLAGGILSFLVMLLLKRIKGFSMIGVSIAGGVSHNIGQIAVAMCVLENTKLVYYLPVLMIAGTITGILIGVVSQKILPAVSQGAGAERKKE